MTPRVAFECDLAEMRQVVGGTLIVDDYFPKDGRPPYRYAEVFVIGTLDDYERRAAELARLAVSVIGYLTMHTNGHAVARIGVAISRELEPDEIGEIPADGRARPVKP